MTSYDAEANAKASVFVGKTPKCSSTSAETCGQTSCQPSCATLTMQAGNYAADATEAAHTSEQQANLARTHRQSAQDAALNAREHRDHAGQYAKQACAAAAECQSIAKDLQDGHESLACSLQDLKVILKAEATAHADAPKSPPPQSCPQDPCPPQQVHTVVEHHHVHTGGGGTPVEDVASAMSQLNTLLLGSSPAFAQAMRLQTDAIASGLGSLNAISNQQSHYALELASTARGIVEAYDRGARRDPAAK